jgi:hypothetical protein
MHGNVPPLPQYAFMAWYLVKKRETRGKIYLYLSGFKTN